MAEQHEREPGKVSVKTSASVADLDKQPEADPKKKRVATAKPVTREKAVALIVDGLTWVNDTVQEFVPAYGMVPGLALNALEIKMEAEALADLPEVRKLLAVSGVNNPYMKLLWVNVVIVSRRVKLYREMSNLAKQFGINSPKDAADLQEWMSNLINMPGTVPPPATAG